MQGAVFLDGQVTFRAEQVPGLPECFVEGQVLKTLERVVRHEAFHWPELGYRLGGLLYLVMQYGRRHGSGGLLTRRQSMVRQGLVSVEPGEHEFTVAFLELSLQVSEPGHHRMIDKARFRKPVEPVIDETSF